MTVILFPQILRSLPRVVLQLSPQPTLLIHLEQVPHVTSACLQAPSPLQIDMHTPCESSMLRSDPSRPARRAAFGFLPCGKLIIVNTPKYTSSYAHIRSHFNPAPPSSAQHDSHPPPPAHPPQPSRPSNPALQAHSSSRLRCAISLQDAISAPRGRHLGLPSQAFWGGKLGLGS